MYSSVRRAPIVVGTVGLCCCCVDGLFAVVPPVAFIVVCIIDSMEEVRYDLYMSGRQSPHVHVHGGLAYLLLGLFGFV